MEIFSLNPMQRWQKEIASAITTVEELSKKIKLTQKEIEDIKKVTGKTPRKRL